MARRMISSKSEQWIDNIKDEVVYDKPTNTVEVGGHLSVDGDINIGGLDNLTDGTNALIQVVTALPTTPVDGVIYIVTGA